MKDTAALDRARISGSTPATDRRVHYRTVSIDGLEVFYREAGPRHAPTILLLHGFPTSPHMFRDLIPLLAERFHVVAPDYPRYGYSLTPGVPSSTTPSTTWRTWSGASPKRSA